MKSSLIHAFEATVDDVAQVLENAGLDTTDAAFMFETHIQPKLEDVARAALDGGDDLDAQTTAAWAEIHRLLVNGGVITSAPGPSC